MEESGKTIRDEEPEPPQATPCSWLCDEHDSPRTQYVHETNQIPFRIKVGALTYERFGENPKGESLYRRVK